MKRLKLTAALLCLAPLFAQASGVFDRSILVEKQRLELVGSASLTWLWYKAYDAALWAPGGVYDPQDTHAIELHYDMKFTQVELLDESIKQLKRMKGVTPAQLKRWRTLLASLSLSVISGDRVRMISTPGTSIRFSKNGTDIKSLKDAELSNHYLQIWLSDDSEYPSVTKQLRGRDS